VWEEAAAAAAAAAESLFRIVHERGAIPKEMKNASESAFPKESKLPF
jgi:hypothetical protein